MPLIGETAKRQFVATGFSGNGITFGTLSAMMIRDAIVGRKNPWRDLFDPQRTQTRGGVWKLDGRRVATYRNAGGQVTQLSAVCTHLGCIVHWNEAETSWDCPCHGARFDVTGTVIAGPAETRLERVEEK